MFSTVENGNVNMSKFLELDSLKLLNPKRLLKVINAVLVLSQCAIDLSEHKKILLSVLSLLSILQKDKKFTILDALESQLSIRE